MKNQTNLTVPIQTPFPNPTSLDRVYAHTYRVSVTFQVVTPESAEDGECADQGFEIESESVGGEELVRILARYAAAPCRGDGTRWYCSAEAEPNYLTGEETSYAVHVAILVARGTGPAPLLTSDPNGHLWEIVEPHGPIGQALSIEAFGSAH